MVPSGGEQATCTLAAIDQLNAIAPNGTDRHAQVPRALPACSPRRSSRNVIGRARHVAAVNGARPLRPYGKGARGGEVCGNDGPGCGRCAYAYAMPNVIPTASTPKTPPRFRRAA